MGAIRWRNASNGDFALATNWDSGSVPGAADDVTLGQPATVSDTVSEAILSLVVSYGATLALNSVTGLFQIGQDVENSGNLLVDFNVQRGGGSNLQIGGNFLNGGTFRLGNYGNRQASIATIAGTLSDYGFTLLQADVASATLTVGDLNLGIEGSSGILSINSTSDTGAKALVEVTAAVAPNELIGSLTLDGNTQLDYRAGGSITQIGPTADLAILGTHAFVTSKGDNTHSSALDGLISNTGTLELYAGAVLTLPGSFANSGTVLVTTGFGVGYSYISGGSATLSVNSYAQSAGLTKVDGTLSAAALTINGGMLVGKGTIIGGVTEAGGVLRSGDADPNYGKVTYETLTVTGSLTLNSAGTIEEDVTGSTDINQIAVSGGVTLNGGDLYVPFGSFSDGQIYTVLSFAPGALSGHFDHLIYGALPGNRQSVTGNSSYVAIGGGLYIKADYENAAGLIQIEVTKTPISARAVPVITPATVAIGNVHLGDTGTVALTVGNAATAPADALNATIASVTGGAVASGAIAGLAPGATNTTSLRVGIDTSSAGNKTGQATIALVSDSGGGVTASLPNDVVQVTGAVYRDAAASIAPVNTIVHVGDPGTIALTVANIAASDGYSENLLATLAGVTGGITGSSGAVAIAPGASGSVTIGLDTSKAATIAGSASFTLASDGGTGAGSLDGLGQTALGAKAATVSVTVDNYANPDFHVVADDGTGDMVVGTGTDETLDLGTIARGTGPLTIGLGVLNDAMGPTDALSGTLTASGSSAFSASGLAAFAGLGAGQSDTAPEVALDTSADGTFSDVITVSGTGSNASGYSGALAPRRLTITGTVANFPAPVIGAPATESVFAGLPTLLGPIQISDAAPAEGGMITVTVSDANGMLSATAAGSIELTYSSTKRLLTLVGDLGDINKTLASLIYKSVDPETDVVQVSVVDGYRKAAQEDFGVVTTPLEKTNPVIVAPSILYVGTSNLAALPFKFADPSADANNSTLMFDLQSTDTSEQLVASGPGGAVISGQSTSHLTITGTPAALNAYASDSILSDIGILLSRIFLVVNTPYPQAAVRWIGIGGAVAGVIYYVSSFFPPHYGPPVTPGGPPGPPMGPHGAGAGPHFHMESFAGNLITIDSEGEYLLTASASGTFVVEARLQPIGSSSTGSGITQLAILGVY